MLLRRYMRLLKKLLRSSFCLDEYGRKDDSNHVSRVTIMINVQSIHNF